MNFKQLEYFAAVAEAKSFSGAARALHVAQPPISRQIAMLEDELGVCLFLRTNKGIELTEAGQNLYRHSQHLFQEFRMMIDSVKDVGAGLRGVLKIGTVFSDVPLMLNALHTYRKTYPQVELYIRLGSPSDLLADLENGKLHVLFLRSPSNEGLGIHEMILGEDPLSLVMCRDLDPAPDEKSIPLEALAGVPMCLLRSDDLWGYSSRLLSAFHAKEIQPNIVCQCYDTPMALQLVEAGFGISYLPRSIVENQPAAGLIAKPVRGLPAMSYPTLVWSGDLYYAACVKQFIELFRHETA